MFYNDFLSLFYTSQQLKDGIDQQVNPDTPRGIIREAGNFRVVSANRFDELKEVQEALSSHESFCLIPEKLALKHDITNGEYCVLATSEQFAQNKTKGSQVDFSGEKEYLFKMLTCPNTEEIDKMGDIVLLPDLIFHNLGLAEDSYIILKKLEEPLNSKALEIYKTKKDFPLKVAKKITCRMLVNKYHQYATPELIYTLLKEKKLKVINRHETLVLNFYNKIGDDLFSKLSKTQRSKFLRLNAEKLVTPMENFIFLVQVKDIESPAESKAANEHAHLEHAFVFDAALSGISLEGPPLNSFIPARRLPISKNFSSEFLNTVFGDLYIQKVLKVLGNLFTVSMQNRGQFSQSKMILALSHPHGVGLSLLLKKLTLNFGFNFLEKNVRECYSLQEVEKVITKGIYMRPSIVLLKKFTHMKTFLDQKASISHSNSLSSYIEHLSGLVKAVAMQHPDNLPCLIILAENQREKVEEVYSEASEMLRYVVHVDPPTEAEHAGTLRTLLKWFGITLDDIEELGTLSKGLSWKQIYKMLQQQRKKEPESDFKVQNFKSKIEQTKKETNMVNSLNIPNVTWQDVGGLIEAKNEIIDTIMLPQWYPQLFQNKIKPRTGILFFGPPGTGKTMLAKAVANECKMNFMSVKGPELLNMYVGESEKNVREIFDKARSNLPCIIFFDELDALVPNRGHGSDSSQVMDRIVAQFLTEIDGLQKEGGLFIIGATNRPDLLDPSLLRPGRFDKMVYLGINEDKESRVKILEAQTRKFTLGKDVDFGTLEESIPKNFTGADFYALTSGAILMAVKRKISLIDEKYAKEKESGEEVKTFEEWSRGLSKEELEVEVSNEDFMESLKGITPSVSTKELGRYEELRQKYALT